MGTTFAILPQDLVSLLTTDDGERTNSWRDLPFLRLPNPRTDLPSLYIQRPALADKSAQMLEIQAIAPDSERSWFMGDNVISDGKLLILTPVDAVFLLIPILRAVFGSDLSFSSSPKRFRTAEDIFEEASEKLTRTSNAPSSQDRISHFDSPVRKSTSKGKGQDDRPVLASDIISLGTLESVALALPRLCETNVLAPDMVVYRYSDSRLLEISRTKVARLADPKVFGTFATLQRSLARVGLLESTPGEDTPDAARSAPTEIVSLARSKAACDLVGHYLPPDLCESLLKSYDFASLEEHIKAAEVVPDRPPEGFTTSSGSKSKPRAGKAKVAPEKKATAPSRGVGSLKKADTKGMSKLSTFFQKKD